MCFAKILVKTKLIVIVQQQNITRMQKKKGHEYEPDNGKVIQTYPWQLTAFNCGAERSTVAKQIWQPIDPRNFGCDFSVRPYARPYRLLGRGKGVPRQPDGGGQPDGGWRIPSFLGGKSCGAFGQPAFFLAGNRMITVAFEKEVFWKTLIACLPKRLFDSTEILNWEKRSNNYKWKEKFQKNTQLSFWWNPKSSSYEICLRGFHVGFLHGGELVLSWNNRVSEVFKGFKVHDLEYYGQRTYVLKWKVN